MPKDVKWHFIGHLQSNKCKLLASIPNLVLVQTIDGKNKAKELNKHFHGSILVQVNTSGEENKGGVHPNDCLKLVEYIRDECRNLSFRGLMTIGEIRSAEVKPNPDFLCLIKCKEMIE